MDQGPENPMVGIPAESDSPALGVITPLMIAHLRATKPWVRLVSVVGFFGSAIILVVAFAMPFVGALSRELGGAVGGTALGLVYLFLGCFYFFPSLFLFRYASAIQSLLLRGGSTSMELALSHQKSFWRLVGIGTLVVLCLYALVLVVAVLAGIASAFK